MKAIVLIFLILTLGGCASDIPRPIQIAPEVNVSYAQALKEPDKLRGTAVRWGGVIANVENRSDETWIEIVDQPLEKYGYPHATDRSAGRFLAQVSGFVDPVLYTTQRRITVAGKLEGTQQQRIGEHPYTYPVVRVEHLHLWPLPPKTVNYYYPFPYDPWYPWGYPYRHRPLR